MKIYTEEQLRVLFNALSSHGKKTIKQTIFIYFKIKIILFNILFYSRKTS